MQSDYDRDENHTLAATEEKFLSNTRSEWPVIEPELCFPSRKKRISFKDHQKLKTDETELDKELKNFQSCCIRKCYTWLTMQLLLYCRRQYILQPDYNFRRKWLEDEYQRLETGRRCYCYNTDVMGQHTKQCCMETWAFALWHPYGHPQETTQSIHSKQKKKN